MTKEEIRAYNREWKRRARASGSEYYQRQKAAAPGYLKKNDPDGRRRAAWWEANKDRPDVRLKKMARAAVATALRHGTLTKPEACQLCGAVPHPRNLWADHWHGYDESAWTDVQWVCITCNGRLVRERGESGRLIR